MKQNALLTRLGLSVKESILYTALLDHGASTISLLAKHTGIHRPAIYKTIPLLQEKGLITSFLKGKLIWYTAEHPDKLLPHLEEFKHALETEFIDMRQSFTTTNKRPIVKFLEGKKGIQFVYTDIATTLKKGDVFYRYSSRKDTTNADKYLTETYVHAREDKQLERFVITSESVAKTKKPRLDRAMKSIPPNVDLFDDDITQIIYGPKVAFIDYNSESAFVIESPLIAKFQQKLFMMLFQRL